MKNEIDYMSVFTNLSDSAFTQCKKSLFPMFFHPYYSIDDYRKIDCTEDFYAFEQNYFFHHKIKADHTVYFVKCLKFYFQNYLLCKPNSLASKYYKHAMELIDQMIGSDKADLSALYDVVKMYICLAREDAPDFNDETKMIERISFELLPSDIEVLMMIRDYQFKIPQKFELPKEIKLGPIKADNIFAIAKYLDEDKRKFNYLYTVLFFYYILDSEGAFRVKENLTIRNSSSFDEKV